MNLNSFIGHRAPPRLGAADHTANGRIHEWCELNLNRGRSAYHEYEYGKGRAIMNLNSFISQYSSVFKLNTLVFTTCPALAVRRSERVVVTPIAHRGGRIRIKLFKFIHYS